LDLSQLNPTTWVVYTLMMYLSSYPFILSVQSTAQSEADVPQSRRNQYHEPPKGWQQLSSTPSDANSPNTDIRPQHRSSSYSDAIPIDMRRQGPLPPSRQRSNPAVLPPPIHPPVGTIVLEKTRKIATREVFWIYIAVLAICVAEYSEEWKVKDYVGFSIFKIFFEVVSGYGTVGLSLGHPSTTVNLCSLFTTFSKFVLILVMLFGRHRDLPETLDQSMGAIGGFALVVSKNTGAGITSPYKLHTPRHTLQHMHVQLIPPPLGEIQDLSSSDFLDLDVSSANVRRHIHLAPDTPKIFSEETPNDDENADVETALILSHAAVEREDEIGERGDEIESEDEAMLITSTPQKKTPLRKGMLSLADVSIGISDNHSSPMHFVPPLSPRFGHRKAENAVGTSPIK